MPPPLLPPDDEPLPLPPDAPPVGAAVTDEVEPDPELPLPPLLLPPLAAVGEGMKLADDEEEPCEEEAGAADAEPGAAGDDATLAPGADVEDRDAREAGDELTLETAAGLIDADVTEAGEELALVPAAGLVLAEAGVELALPPTWVGDALPAAAEEGVAAYELGGETF